MFVNFPDVVKNNWFQTKNKKIISYLLKYVSPIHIENEIYFFKKTKEFKNAFDNMPKALRIVNFLKI